MKLAAISFVAALALAAGCAEEPTTTGGSSLEGLRPTKPSIDNPDNSPTPPNPKIFEGNNLRGSVDIPELGVNVTAEAIKPPIPMKGVCDGCDVIAFHIDHGNEAEETRLFSDGGEFLCRIFVNDGGVVFDDCGFPNK